MKPLLIVLLGVALVGLLNVSYLTWKHYSGRPPVCSVLAGCEKVTSSKYSTIGGVPLAACGVLFYGCMSALIAVYAVTGGAWYWYALKVLAFAGFAVSVWFVYLQIFVIGALCLYCMVSAVDATVLFGGLQKRWLIKTG